MLDLLFQREVLGIFLAGTLIHILLGAAILLPFRAGFINLGLSAQLIAGAIAATYVGHFLGSFWLAAVACFVIVFALGIVPVWLRCRCGTNEVFTTLLLTFAAIPLAQWFLRTTTSTVEVASPHVLESAFRATAILGGYVNAIHFLAVPGLLLTWLAAGPSAIGYRARALKANPRIFSSRESFVLLTTVMFVASTLTAVAVMADAYVYKGRYVSGDYNGLGFVALAVALIALGRPTMLVPAAALVAATDVVFLALSVHYGVPQIGDYLVYGLAILGAAAFLRTRNEDLHES